MKSLVEEASSVSKAVEKGWENAGKPKEFTVKVYEEAEKNFFGLTSRPAKIAIFFTETASEPRRKKARPEPKKRRDDKPREEKPREEKPKTPFTEREDLGPIWSDEMVESIKQWLTTMLGHMDMNTVPFTIAPEKFHLKIHFSDHLHENRSRQKHLFAVFSNILLTMLKRHVRRPLKAYKIVVTAGSDEGSQ